MSNDTNPPPIPGSDATVRRPRPARYGAAPVTLVGDDGRQFKVTGTAVVGRSPTATAELGAVNLVVIDDASRSLSKTHAVLILDDGRLWVIDRASTNGTAISGSSGTATVSSDAWAEVFAGDFLLFGDRWCQVVDGVGPRPPTQPISALPTATSASGGRPATLPEVAAAARFPDAAVPSSAVAPVAPVPPAPVLEMPAADATPSPSPSPAGLLPPPPDSVVVADQRADPPVPPADPSGAAAAPPTGSVPTPAKRPRPTRPLTKQQRKARRRYLKAKRASAGSKSSGRKRVLTAIVALAVVGGGALAVRRFVLDADGAVDAAGLPRLVDQVDEPSWVRSFAGTWLAPVAAGGDLYVTSMTAEAGERAVNRVDGDTGDVVWTTALGDATPWVSAVSDGVVLVTEQDEAGARRLIAIDADDGGELWDAPISGDVIVSGGQPFVRGTGGGVRAIAPGRGLGPEVVGDLVVLRDGAVMVMTAGLVSVYDGDDLTGTGLPAFEPWALPVGTELLTFDGSSVLTSEGAHVTALDRDGAVRLESDLDVELAAGAALAGLAAVGRDTVIVSVSPESPESPDISMFHLVAGTVEASWTGPASRPIDADADGYVVEPGADGVAIRSTPDGTVVGQLDGAFVSATAARGHVAVQMADRLAAFDDESGEQTWSIPVGGFMATVVDGGLALSTYDPDDDTTELRYFG